MKTKSKFTVRFLCGCGQYNHNLEDWTCHFKYRGFLNGMKNLMKTRIIFTKKPAYYFVNDY